MFFHSFKASFLCRQTVRPWYALSKWYYKYIAEVEPYSVLSIEDWIKLILASLWQLLISIGSFAPNLKSCLSGKMCRRQLYLYRASDEANKSWKYFILSHECYLVWNARRFHFSYVSNWKSYQQRNLSLTQVDASK